MNMGKDPYGVNVPKGGGMGYRVGNRIVWIMCTGEIVREGI